MTIHTFSLSRLGLLLGVLFLSFSSLAAQQFGRNKPNYEKFDFKVYESPRFRMYTYLTDPVVINQLLDDSEEWYDAHQRILHDTIKERNPLMIYANHPDFQQTNAIQGAIGVGTGGVTEAFKNRVIMPTAMSNQQTHHVLGHELVHAFQYNMIINGDSTKLNDLGNLPLWMVEGLAEYLSIGGTDPFTAMWMRDAVLNDDVPSIKDLSSGKYFPYRYGQAFWAFVTGLKGDDVIAPYFRLTAQFGLEKATPLALGYSLKDLNKLWEDGLRKTYAPYVGDTGKDRFIGRPLAGDDKNDGRLNISPSISPNGRYVIYLSEKDLFSIDLFLADANNGKVIRKISSTNRSGHLDDFSYLESGGTWSPDSRRYAYVGVSQGDNVLVIADTESGKTLEQFRPEEIPAFAGPVWSPDGRTIVVSGSNNGQVDLYGIDARTGRVTQLTDDRYSETLPAWSVDGSRILFSTDRISYEQDRRPYGALRFNLASLEVATGKVTDFDLFPGADNLNPQEDLQGRIVFLSNRDGFRNIYRYDPATDSLEQLSDFITGVSGITHYAPAISLDRKRNKIVYTYFSQKKYRIYQADSDDFTPQAVDRNAVDFGPATLPRLNSRAPLSVDDALATLDPTDNMAADSIQQVPYRSKFKLDYAGGGVGGGVGVGGGNQVFGNTAGLAGGAQLLFSDILGNHQFLTGLQLNGELSDFGGSLAYINRKNQLNWGVTVGRTPFRSFGREQAFVDTLNYGNDLFQEVVNAPYLIQRLLQNQVGVFAQFPFSSKLRAEASASYSFFNTTISRYNQYYDSRGFRLQTQDNRPERLRDQEPDPFQLGTVGAALVGDNSSFGITAPLNGSRFRLGADRYFGALNFTNLTADYRKYHFFGKFAGAFRITHQGRYGGQHDEIFPLYVGSPWHMRGLQGNATIQALDRSGRNFEELFGSKLLVSSAEIRIPFTGPEQLSLIKSGLFLSDLNFFIDGGMAWSDFSQFGGATVTLDQFGEPLINPSTGQPYVTQAAARPIFTAGAGLRINLFGQFIIEPYYAIPLIKGANGSFGLNIIPGW